MSPPRPSEPRREERDSLEGALRPAWVRIDLDALERNYRRLSECVAPAGVLAVVKGDAYGHGACHLARTLELAGVDLLGVALVEEGAELRRFGSCAPILVFGTAQAAQLPLFRRYRLTPTVSSLDQLELWRAWVRSGGGPQSVHLQVDTGMTRLGLAPEQVGPALERLRDTPGLELAGFASHLAEADQLDSDASSRQAERFAELLGLLSAAEREAAWIHLANSAGALHHPPCRFALVRVGMALLGTDPSGVESDLEAVMSVTTRLVQVREAPRGTKVSYGGRATLSRPTRIGVVPVGYADGLPWRLGGSGAMLSAGRRLPILGAVTMDMTMVDITDVGGEVGDEVVILGAQGEERITATELARLAGTIPYEIVSGFGLRLPRSYHRGGRWIEGTTRFAAAGR